VDTSTACHVTGGALLDSWSTRSWSDGLQVDSLAPAALLEVRTRNSVYWITVVSGESGEILVLGGRYFPIVTRARFNGCTMGGSLLKVRGLYTGFRMEIQVDRHVIVTSDVRSIRRVEVDETTSAGRTH
jgi:hypothetical protein